MQVLAGRRRTGGQAESDFDELELMKRAVAQRGELVGGMESWGRWWRVESGWAFGQDRNWHHRTCKKVLEWRGPMSYNNSRTWKSCSQRTSENFVVPRRIRGSNTPHKQRLQSSIPNGMQASRRVPFWSRQET
jgi:hypothetical protein